MASGSALMAEATTSREEGTTTDGGSRSVEGLLPGGASKAGQEVSSPTKRPDPGGGDGRGGAVNKAEEGAAAGPSGARGAGPRVTTALAGTIATPALALALLQTPSH